MAPLKASILKMKSQFSMLIHPKGFYSAFVKCSQNEVKRFVFCFGKLQKYLNLHQHNLCSTNSNASFLKTLNKVCSKLNCFEIHFIFDYTVNM